MHPSRSHPSTWPGPRSSAPRVDVVVRALLVRRLAGRDALLEALDQLLGGAQLAGSLAERGLADLRLLRILVELLRRVGDRDAVDAGVLVDQFEVVDRVRTRERVVRAVEVLLEPQ